MRVDYKLKYLKYKLKYFKLKNEMIGGNGNGLIKKFTYNEISDLDCGDNCIMKNNKIIKISLDRYMVSVSNDRISLYDSNAKYSEFSIDNFDIHFGYLKEMIKIMNKVMNVNNSNNTNKKYNILVLGFGLGGAPLNFSKYDDITSIDTIDLDYNLFRLFKKTTVSHNINVSKKINYIYGNAIDYLKYCGENNIKYDFILDDIFESSKKVDYDLGLIYNCLKKNGVFFMNVHYNPQRYSMMLKRDNYKNVGYVENNEYLVYAQK